MKKTTLFVEARLRGGKSVVSARARVSRIALGETVLVKDRRLELDARHAGGLELTLLAPEGDYEALVLHVADLQLRDAKGAVLKGAADRGEATIKLPLRLRRDRPARMVLEVDGEALLAGSKLAVALRAETVSAVVERAFETGDGEQSFRLSTAGLDLEPRSLPAGTRVVLRMPEADGLPALFRDQRRVGPVVEIEADAELKEPAEVTVPFDPGLAAVAGVAPENLVVLHLENLRYHELRPVRVDTAARTLTVRTRSLSPFFACTPGLEIHEPEVRMNGWGQALGLRPGDTATIAGRVHDPDAQVTLRLPQGAPGGWNGLGRFSFEDVPLGPGETPVLVEASVEGLVTHSCEFVLRSGPPPKWITSPSRLYGPKLAVSSADLPVASAVVHMGRSSGEDRFESIADWQGSYERHLPFLYRPTDDRGGWQNTRLLPDAHFENEAARLAIRALQPLLPISLDPNAPERVRALASIAARANGLAQDDSVRKLLIQTLNLTQAWFGAGALNVSPTTPLVMLEGGRVGAAFVVANLEGVDAAEASSLPDVLGILHGRLDKGTEHRPRILAGRLLFARVDFAKGVEHETVAEGIWCASVALKIDPVTGQPAILALGIAPDEGDQKRSRLRLFRRQADGKWTEELVLSDRPVVDADFAFGTDGGVRIVAAVAASDLEPKTHLISVRRGAAGWTATPMTYPIRNGESTSDRGLWPRSLVDAQGRSVVAFSEFVAALVWWIAVEEGNGWRMAVVQTATHMDLTGSPLPPPTSGFVNFDIPVFPSGVGVSHWAPAIVPAGPDAVWYAYGNGMLNLARIRIPTLEIERGVVEVDRSTGFYPSLALRSSGAPAFVYKDPWGPGIGGLRDTDNLHFLSVDDGNVVPGGPRFEPLMPPHAVTGFSIAGFATHVDLTGDNILDSTLTRRLLASIVMHRRFDVRLYPKAGEHSIFPLAYERSHPLLANMIKALPSKPLVTVFSIDNSQFPGEEIERIDITSFDPIATLPTQFAADLDQSRISDDLSRNLAGQGVHLLRSNLTVRVIAPGHEWEVVTAFAASVFTIPQTYRIRRRNEQELEVRALPVISVIDRAGGSPDGLGRPRPTGRDQEDWDVVGSAFVGRFTGLGFQIPDDTPGEVIQLNVPGIHVSRYEIRDPASDQQGGVRFTIRIPRFSIRNEEPDGTIYTTEPSFIFVTLAPFVRDGRIRWWIREAELRMGNVEADLDIGIVDWLRWLAVIPGVGFLLLLLDPIADAVATSLVQDEVTPPDTSSLHGLLAEALQGWVDDLLGPEPPYFEAVHMRRFYLRTWIRSQHRDNAQRSILNALPASISFPQAVIGEGPVRRNLLLTSDGNVPVLLEEVSVSAGGPEIRLENETTWPAILEPGDSLIVRLAFEPVAPAGFRTGTVRAVFNGGRTVEVPLHGNAHPALEPSLRLRPSPALQFGVVVAGQRTQREIEVFNDGSATLMTAAPRTVGDADFSVVSPAPLSVPPGGSAVIRMDFAPPVNSPVRSDGTLILESNDPSQPRAELRLVGFASAPGTLLVTPLEIRFNDSALDSAIPPLPPGTPPTVHRGATRSTTLYNTGTGTLTIQGSSFRALDPNGAVSPHFHLWQVDGSAMGQVNRVLPSGASLPVVIQFLPTVAGEHEALLEIRSTDPTQSVVVVRVSGRGVA